MVHLLPLFSCVRPSFNILSSCLDLCRATRRSLCALVFALLQPLFEAAYPQCPSGSLLPGFARSSCVCWSKTSSGVCNVHYSVSDTLT